MINKLEKSSCTGCGVCFNICPKGCITMQEAEDGFLYPIIDEVRCVQCNLCEQVCPGLNQFIDKKKRQPQIKAAWSLNEDIRFSSTSGGIFSELAGAFLAEEGYIVGARYTKKFLVEHYIIDKIEQIPILRQSKYIQSDKKDIFKQVKTLLDQGKKVLFVGAPCEIAGLYYFLRKEYEHLITVDFICLGANSPKVYMKFLDALEDIYHSKVKKVWFKNKTYGWNRFSTKVEFENGDFYLKDRDCDYFMRGYIGKNKFYIRPCCTNCRYKTLPRVADLTLADFWGVVNKNKELDEDKGTSLIMINSDKGNSLFEKILSNIYSTDCELQDAVPGNMAIFNSVQLNTRREQFFDDLDRMRFDKLIEKYCAVSKKEKIKQMIKKYLMPRKCL